MKHRFSFENVDCGHCAAQIETELNKTADINDAQVNFMTKKITIDSDIQETDVLMNHVFQTSKKVAPEIHLIPEDQVETEWNFDGVDCGSCALKIEEAVQDLDDVVDAQVNFMTKKIQLTTVPGQEAQMLNRIRQIAKEIEPDITITQEADQVATPTSPSIDDMLRRIIIASVLFIIGMVGLWQNWLPTLMISILLITYGIIGHDIVLRTWTNLKNRQWFDENSLMTIATLGALALGEFGEAVTVMLFYQIGEYFQARAVRQSRNSIQEILDIQPETAHVIQEGTLVTLPARDIPVGAMIEVLVGERVPLDGIVIEGASSIDTAALSGESEPVAVSEGAEVLSGSINLSHRLTLKTTSSFDNSTVAQIIDLVEHATDQKAPSENFITRFAKYYTPTVVFAALALAILPPIFLNQSFQEWVHRALIFLVVSCPCALVVSVPLSFFGGIGGASKAGILVKGGNYLEALSQVEVMLFDKTGTLTKGNFEVTEIHPIGVSEAKLIEITATVESNSTHPIAQSIQKMHGQVIDQSAIQALEEIAGQGLKALMDDQEILVGNRRLMETHGVDLTHYADSPAAGTIVFTAVVGQLIGWMLIEDEIKQTTPAALQALSNLQVKEMVMLTGDRQVVAEQIGQTLNLDRIESELLPADKINYLEEYLTTNSERPVAFVGDGMNDAPSLARADVGIAMGGVGSDAAIEVADVVIMNDDLSTLVKGINISRKTMKIVRQNVWFILGVKFLVLGLSAFGLTSMWAAIFADVGVTVLAVLNAMRSLNIDSITE